MRIRCSSLCVLVAAVSLLVPQPLLGGWIEDGIELDGAPYDQGNVSVIGDGEGGAVVVWMRGLNEGGYLKGDIYAQRLDRWGNSLWTSGGQPICVLTEDQTQPKIVADGEGGYIICWTDLRPTTHTDIYAQRIDADGTPLWTTNGVAVCTAAYGQGNPVMIPFEGGGAVIAWQDTRSGTNYDVYAQRVSNAGSMLWTADGVAVCTDPSFQEQIRIAPGSDGGTNVVWQDSRNGQYDIYANYLSASGSPNWGTSGNCICCDPASQSSPEMVSEGLGGAIVAWVDMRNGNADIYGTRVYYGSGYWGAGEASSICSAAGNQNYHSIERYGVYGAVVAWRDERGGNVDLYAQRIDVSNNRYWATDGIAICSYVGTQAIEDIAEDGAGNLVFVWFDTRDIYNDLYAQKVDGDGAALWDPRGVPVATERYNKCYSKAAADGDGGVIVAWQDYRSGDSDLYAQRIDAVGCWGYPSPEITSIADVPGDQGGALSVEWTRGELDVFPYEVITHYSVWRSLSDPETAAALSRGEKSVDPVDLAPDFEGRAYRFVTLDGATYGWEWIGNVPAHRLETYAFTAPTLFDSTGTGDGWHHFFVSSHCDDPFAYWDSPPDSGYSVDNLSPEPPAGLAGEQQHGPEGLLLTWAPNIEEDLFGYRVYRGLSSDFIPGEGNLLAALPDTLLLDDEWRWDEGYFYKVSAVDVHGNESGCALLSPSQLTGDEPGDVPSAVFLAQNWPNPFNPGTTIAFGLKERGHTSLRIYDAAGRLVARLVEETMPAGRHTMVWDGRDRNEAPAA
ncbi:MAG: FlgD immunoglobulin-like domain containing protein, partial [Candidatus Krumholzibacteria bacterium]|nr:FlgD immunoglobulin-like domain containing protein [Candidatus Krumholzibacteria bacterium]